MLHYPNAKVYLITSALDFTAWLWLKKAVYFKERGDGVKALIYLDLYDIAAKQLRQYEELY